MSKSGGAAGGEREGVEGGAGNLDFDSPEAIQERKDRVARENAEIDAVLARRIKKIDVEIPLVSYSSSGSTIRKVFISNKEYDHLDAMIKGTKYGICERPDIEVHTIGIGAKKPKKYKKKKGLTKEEKKADMERFKLVPKDLSGGKGVELMYDKAKKLYIMCERQEDKLLLLLQGDSVKGMEVSTCITRNDSFEHLLVEPMQQKIWRRFCLLHLLPYLKNAKRMEDLTLRFITEVKGGGGSDKSGLGGDGDEEGEGEETKEDNKEDI